MLKWVSGISFIIFLPVVWLFCSRFQSLVCELFFVWRFCCETSGTVPPKLSFSLPVPLAVFQCSIKVSRSELLDKTSHQWYGSSEKMIRKTVTERRGVTPGANHNSVSAVMAPLRYLPSPTVCRPLCAFTFYSVFFQEECTCRLHASQLRFPKSQMKHFKLVMLLNIARHTPQEQ